MNKTNIVQQLPCGCWERRWLFGRDVNPGCGKCRPSADRPYAWSLEARP